MISKTTPSSMWSQAFSKDLLDIIKITVLSILPEKGTITHTQLQDCLWWGHHSQYKISKTGYVALILDSHGDSGMSTDEK